jgi:hypothetical protein
MFLVPARFLFPDRFLFFLLVFLYKFRFMFLVNFLFDNLKLTSSINLELLWAHSKSYPLTKFNAVQI